MVRPTALVRAAVAVLLLGLAIDVVADAPPWRRRRRPDIQTNHRAATLITPEDWPAEPSSPREVDPERFARALRELCGWMPPERPANWTGYILSAAREHGEDPFLLGALVHRMGRCQPDAEELGGVGVTLIPSRMYWEDVRGGRYRYWVKDGARWAERTIAVDRFPFNDVRLKRPEENLYFAAAFLKGWRDQHESLQGAFEQHPHRHYVSHFVYGDRVLSDRAEDRILLDRRRLLQYYGALREPAPLRRLGLEIGSPLDGQPRVISSWLGAEREGGRRSHRGIDVESVLGEPVRAIADGRVNFAGVDLPGSRSNENMTPEQIEQVPRQSLGNGGRYVCILHRPAGEGAAPWLRSCYMHLEDVEVRWGQEVRRGERIGTVGRTGMISSAPHLHLELHGPDGLMDPSEHLAGPLLGRNPEAAALPRRRR